MMILRRTFSFAAVLVALATGAHAQQQRTIYDHSGKAISRSVTDTQGTTVTYDAGTGRAVTRETRDGTIYSAQSGRTLGKAVRGKR